MASRGIQKLKSLAPAEFNKSLMSASTSLTYKRYGEIASMLERVKSLIDTIVKSGLGKGLLQYNPEAYQKIVEFRDSIVIAPLPHYEFASQIDNLSDEEIAKRYNPEVEDFNVRYLAMKKHPANAIMIIISNKLSPYKESLTDSKQSCDFLLKMRPMTFCPFPFTNLDVREFCVALPASLQNVLALVLYKLYAFGCEIYDLISKSDLNIDGFVGVVRAMLGQIRHVPELSRCNRAFDKIEDSIGLLYTNFDSYYRDSVDTNDPSAMVTSFILDTARGVGKSDVGVSTQLRTIVSFFRKQMDMKKMDKSTKDMLGGLTETLDDMFGGKKLREMDPRKDHKPEETQDEDDGNDPHTDDHEDDGSSSTTSTTK